MTAAVLPDDLLRTIEDALDLLRDYDRDPPLPGREIEPLPSLLEQCETLLAQAPEPEPIRCLHHLACTGGTLLAKSVSVLPNVTLLSEIDPLSPLPLSGGERIAFAPSDLIYAARTALRPVDAETVETVFDSAVRALHLSLCARGRYLVLRDHAHSQFCTEADFDARPTLREQLLRDHAVRSIVTVRHPLDSFLSLQANGWLHFSPGTLQEYCRRYRAFLARHAGLKIFLYEEFLDNPEQVLQQICAELDLAFEPGFSDLLGVVRMSGDSGRKSDRIGRRPRREVSGALQAEAAESTDYADLCHALGYTPDTH